MSTLGAIPFFAPWLRLFVMNSLTVRVDVDAIAANIAPGDRHPHRHVIYEHRQ